MKYYADSKGNYDIKQVMKDIKNGAKRIEIDFSAHIEPIRAKLREQEKLYRNGKRW